MACLRRIASPALAARVAVSLLLLVSLIAVPAQPSVAGTAQDEQYFVSRINDLRASRGLGRLTVHSELTVASRQWAQTMANNDHLSHAPNIASGVTADWKLIGENVGLHYEHDLGELFDAFVASPGHLENLVEPGFTHVGVGVVYGNNGKIWTTHRFMSLKAPSSPPPTTAAPPPTTAAPPPPATTPTTRPAPTPTTAPTTTAPTTRAPSPTTSSPRPDSTPATTAGTVRRSTTESSKPSTTVPKPSPPEPKFSPKLVSEVLSQLELVGI